MGTKKQALEHVAEFEKESKAGWFRKYSREEVAHSLRSRINNPYGSPWRAFAAMPTGCGSSNANPLSVLEPPKPR